MVFQNKIVRAVIFVLFIQLAGFSLFAQTTEQKGINWFNFEEASELAMENDKPILLFLEAEWCGVCKRMHREIFTDKAIKEQLTNHFNPVRIDIESQKTFMYKGEEISHKAFSKQLNLQATPTTFFLQPDHSVIGNKPGYMNVSELLVLLKYIHSDAWKQTTFEQYETTHQK